MSKKLTYSLSVKSALNANSGISVPLWYNRINPVAKGFVDVCCYISIFSEDHLKLKRVSDLIAAYEKIVEGNYIDNLIRAQRELGQKISLENTLQRKDK